MRADPTAELRFSADHCWARRELDGTVTIGLTDFAQRALGAVVFVELPSTGAAFAADEPIAEVESTKAVTEIYAPITGEIAVANSALTGEPGAINTDPLGSGWICTIAPSDPAEFGRLLDPSEYAQLTEGADPTQPSTND